jgi:methylated-DNA-[protein]-cysteine S-methyltransferase|tara:strand:- start:785 stop:1099 length:315 start_codon:yes stop_codon:yes gene_type:complete
MKLAESIYKLCKQIPKGKISTYKTLAEKLNTKAYQAVGQCLRRNPYAPQVPCHRVVNSQGHLHGFGGKTNRPALEKKRKLLAKEGVKVKNNKIVDFEKILYNFK